MMTRAPVMVNAFTNLFCRKTLNLGGTGSFLCNNMLIFNNYSTREHWI